MMVDGWSMRLSLAACRHYGLGSHRKHGQHRTTIVLKVVGSFSDKIFWLEFAQLADALMAHLEKVFERVIRKGALKDGPDSVEGAPSFRQMGMEPSARMPMQALL